MFGSKLVTTGRRRAPWALVATGVLLLGACGDDGDEAEDAGAGDEEAAGASADPEFCTAVEEAQALGDLGDVEDVEADEAGALEDLQAMHQGMLDLEVPEGISEDWDLYFGSAVAYFEGFIEFQEGFTSEADVAEGSEPEDLEDLEDLGANPSEDLLVMDDESVVAAQDAVNGFLQENCDLAI